MSDRLEEKEPRNQNLVEYLFIQYKISLIYDLHQITV